MVILGVADGLDAGAALVVDNRVRAAASEASFDRRPRSQAFPWQSIQAVLSATHTQPEEVGLVAVAGRFTPPFFVRRHPGVHAFTRDPFSPLHGANVFWQRVLRQSGLGAVEADRAGGLADPSIRRARDSAAPVGAGGGPPRAGGGGLPKPTQ